MEGHITYFQVAWFVCCLLLSVILYATVNCLCRSSPGQDLDTEPLMGNNTDEHIALEEAGTEAKIAPIKHETVDVCAVDTDSSPGSGNHENSKPGKATNLSLTLKEVLDKTWEVRAKWENIGIQLGLEDHLEAIKLNRNHEIDDCYREMLKKWLNRKLIVLKI